VNTKQQVMLELMEKHQTQRQGPICNFLNIPKTMRKEQMIDNLMIKTMNYSFLE
jgi:hypothetical protein